MTKEMQLRSWHFVAVVLLLCTCLVEKGSAFTAVAHNCTDSACTDCPSSRNYTEGTCMDAANADGYWMTAVGCTETTVSTSIFADSSCSSQLVTLPSTQGKCESVQIPGTDIVQYFYWTCSPFSATTTTTVDSFFTGCAPVGSSVLVIAFVVTFVLLCM